MLLLIVAAFQQAAQDSVAPNTAHVKPDGTVDLGAPPVSREGGASNVAPLRPEAEAAKVALDAAAHEALVEVGAEAHTHAEAQRPHRHVGFAQAAIEQHPRAPPATHASLHETGAGHTHFAEFALPAPDDLPTAHHAHGAHGAHAHDAHDAHGAHRAHGAHAAKHAVAHPAKHAAHGPSEFGSGFAMPVADGAPRAHERRHAPVHAALVEERNLREHPAPHVKHASPMGHAALLESSPKKPKKGGEGGDGGEEGEGEGDEGKSSEDVEEGEKMEEVKVETPWGYLIGFTLIPILAVLGMVAACTLYGPGSHLNKREEKALLKRNRTRGNERRFDNGEGPFTFMEFQLQYGDEAQAYWDQAQPCPQEEQRRFDNGFGPFTYAEFEAEYGPGPECQSRWDAGIPW